ncbi:MAG: adenylate/guanylate cyclase domain-containing protein [Treponema sp.]|jgi:adenylate cyclase|nr:adenylate/guanylate cyclase domain-containing protein [Treponema sp.]
MSPKRDAPRAGAGAVRFPIGAKLVFMVTAILAVSLGAASFLVSWMVSRDLRLNAEDNNLSVNRRAATASETILSLIRSNALVLLRGAAAGGNSGGRTSGASTESFVRFFFEQNRHIAALTLVDRDGKNRSFINSRFGSGVLDPAAIAAYTASRQEALARAAAGDTLLLTVSPPASSAGPPDEASPPAMPLLGFFFPAPGQGAALVFFSPEALEEIFGAGTNTSFLVNDEGDILVHPDPLLAGTSAATDPLVVLARQSGKPFMQTLYTGPDGTRYFGAFSSVSQGYVITRIEETVVFEGIAATTRRNLYLAGAVLFLAVIFVWFFSKTISGPVKLLAAAAGRIKNGEFEISLPVQSADEIGFLTARFTEMGRGLAERERLKESFGRFTNPAVAERAMRGELSLGGETREVTVFFSDIRSFTAISEKLNPHDVVEFLNDYMTRMVDCVNKTGGVVDKFIGDAVMAVWGAPLTAGSPAKDALNCVKAALLMRAALCEYNKGRGGDKNPVIRIGCGINTGEVVAGQVGSSRRMDYTVIGDAVNLAARTETLNKPLGTDILITENTWNLIGRHLITEEMPTVTVKGKEKPVRMFAVINLKSLEGTKQKKPAALSELRELLGIKAPDVRKVNVNAEEHKYKIGG